MSAPAHGSTALAWAPRTVLRAVVFLNDAPPTLVGGGLVGLGLSLAALGCSGMSGPSYNRTQ